MKAAKPKPHPRKPAAFWRVLFQITPLPMFIVDGDIRIEEFNAAAGDMLKKDKSKILRQRGGDALHCVHAMESPEGCGSGARCKDCMIRKSVVAAIRGRNTHRVRAKMELLQKGRAQRIQLLVTTTPVEFQDRGHVLLMLENVTELLALRELLPVCAHCKKIRDDRQYWHEIDVYLTEYMDMNFSHGVCPDCMKKFRDEFDGHTTPPE